MDLWITPAFLWSDVPYVVSSALGSSSFFSPALFYESLQDKHSTPLPGGIQTSLGTQPNLRFGHSLFADSGSVSINSAIISNSTDSITGMNMGNVPPGPFRDGPAGSSSLWPAMAGTVFNPHYSLTTTTGGEYVLTGSFSGARAPATGWPVVLVYHGGGESAQKILEYSGLSALSAVVISIQGQDSLNHRSWMNAFPWLKDNPRDDVAFTEHVLEEVAEKLPIDRSRIYATGKSDGGGMSVFLAAHPELRNFSVAAIAPVAGAYFGRSQTIGRESYSLPSDATDYDDIILAARKVPVLEMHGTADQVMPYEGGAFITKLALEKYDKPGSFWGRANGFTNDVAYTAPIMSYWATWAQKVNKATNVMAQPFTKSTTEQATLYKFTNRAFTNRGALPLQHLQVVGANHDWFGHANSGPGSTTAASLQLDATQVVADFFRIPLINYKSPVTTGTPKLP